MRSTIFSHPNFVFTHYFFYPKLYWSQHCFLFQSLRIIKNNLLTPNLSTLSISMAIIGNYRVSSKGVYAFVFQISRPARGLEIPSWSIFHSPFCLDYENIHFFIIWLNLDWDICKLLQRDHFKSYHFCFGLY